MATDARPQYGRKPSFGRSLGLVALLLASAACTRPPPPKVGYSSELPGQRAPTQPSKSEPEPKPVPADIVQRSELPFSILRFEDHTALSAVELFDELATKDVVCIGEHHDNPHHHWAELYIVQEMARRAESSGRELGLGLEMFQAPFQEVLDRYALGKLDKSELIQKTEYEARWGYPFAYYAPQIEHAVARGAGLLALNAPREQTQRVAREGLQSLSEHELRPLGDMDLHNRAHRELFDELMRGHPSGMGSIENMYEAQVLWDETMAGRAADWLGAKSPARQLVILAGSAHCHASAIPRRISRRLGAKIVSVRPLMHGSSDPVKEAQGYDYGVILGSE